MMARMERGEMPDDFGGSALDDGFGGDDDDF
jgi:hypothetical protein